MKFNSKPLIVALACMFISVNAQAEIEHKLDSMWRTTSASVHKKGVNGAYSASLGGFSTRSPIQNINLFSFDPPRIRAGCGGIDAQLGAFSLISKDQITRTIKAVMSNAKGYAVKLVINKICPDCLAIANNLEKLGTDLSAGMKNTCELSEVAVDWLANAVSNKEATQNIKNDDENHDYGAIKKAQANEGGNKLRGQTGNTAKDWAQYGNSLLNTLISTHFFEEKQMNIAPYGNEQKFFEVAMSMIGTTIVRTKNKEYSDSQINPIWTMNDFIYGVKPNHKLAILQCSDRFSVTDVESCQNVATKAVDYTNSNTNSNVTWRGTYRYALELLLGEQSDDAYNTGTYSIQNNSLINKLRRNQNGGGSNLNMTEREYEFWVNHHLISPQAKSAFASLVVRQSDEIIIPIAELLAREVAQQLAAEQASALVQSVKSAYNSDLDGGKRRALLTPEQQKAMDDILKEVNRIENHKLERFNEITKVMNDINAMTRTTTSTQITS